MKEILKALLAPPVLLMPVVITLGLAFGIGVEYRRWVLVVLAAVSSFCLLVVSYQIILPNMTYVGPRFRRTRKRGPTPVDAED